MRESEDDLINAIVNVFVKSIASNSRWEGHPTNAAINIFKSSRIPSTTVEDYIGRFTRYLSFHAADVLTTLIYIERALATANCIITPLTFHRLFLSAALSTYKFNIDNHYNNAFFARVAGIEEITELNNLELEFSFLIQFNLFISTE